MRPSSSKGLIHVLANLGGTAWSAIIGIAFVPIYVSRLGIESYGLIGFIAALQVWFSLLDMGFTTTLNREMAQAGDGYSEVKRIKNLLRTLEVVVISIAIVIIVVLAFTGSAIARKWLQVEHLSYSEVESVMSIAGIIIGLRWVSGMYAGALQGLQDQVWLNGARIALTTTRAVGSLIVIYFISNSIAGFFIFQCISFALENIVFVVRVYKKIPSQQVRGQFSLTSLGGVWKYSSSVALYALLGTLLVQSDKMLLSKLVSLSDFGIYSLATVAAGVVTMAASSVYTAAFPRFSAHQSNREGLLREFNFMSQLACFLIAPAALTIFVFSDDFMRFFLHTNELHANEDLLLSIIVAGTMLNSLMYLPVALILASGKPRKLIVINIISVLVFLPGIIYLTPIYGVIGAALMWFGLNLAYITLGTIYIFQHFPYLKKMDWYLFNTFIPLSISAIILIILRWIFIDVHSLFFVGFAFVLSAIGNFFCLPALRNQLYALVRVGKA